jgi:hypothetical protein
MVGSKIGDVKYLVFLCEPAAYVFPQSAVASMVGAL